MTTPAISAAERMLDVEDLDELTQLEQLLQAQHFIIARHTDGRKPLGLNVALRADCSVDVYVRPFGCALPYVVVDDNGYWSYKKRGDVIGSLHELLSNSSRLLPH